MQDKGDKGTMKIREVLEKINSGLGLPKTANEINIGRDRLQGFLHGIGYKFDQREKQWLTDGETPAIIEENIYDHLPLKGDRTIKAKKASNSIIKSNKEIKIDSEPKTNNASKSDSDMKAEIKALITGKQKDKPNKVYRGFYFDNDIADFLENVQHGNKSELVNKIIRAYLVENGLM